MSMRQMANVSVVQSLAIVLISANLLLTKAVFGVKILLLHAEVVELVVCAEALPVADTARLKGVSGRFLRAAANGKTGHRKC